MEKCKKEIRKEFKDNCISSFKDSEKRAKRILKEVSINLLFFSFMLYSSTLDFSHNIFGENICNVSFYILLPISLMFVYLTIKWCRGVFIQKKMQIISRLTFDSIEKDIEKYD